MSNQSLHNSPHFPQKAEDFLQILLGDNPQLEIANVRGNLPNGKNVCQWIFADSNGQLSSSALPDSERCLALNFPLPSPIPSKLLQALNQSLSTFKFQDGLVKSRLNLADNIFVLYFKATKFFVLSPDQKSIVTDSHKVMDLRVAVKAVHQAFVTSSPPLTDLSYPTNAAQQHPQH